MADDDMQMITVTVTDKALCRSADLREIGARREVSTHNHPGWGLAGGHRRTLDPEACAPGRQRHPFHGDAEIFADAAQGPYACAEQSERRSGKADERVLTDLGMDPEQLGYKVIGTSER
jgi:hypothetical protein